MVEQKYIPTANNLCTPNDCKNSSSISKSSTFQKVSYILPLTTKFSKSSSNVSLLEYMDTLSKTFFLKNTILQARSPSTTNGVKKENNHTTDSSETVSASDDARQNLVAHVILAARAQALQLERPGIPSISSLPLPLLDPPKLRAERPGKRPKSYSCNLCGHRTSQKQSLTQHVQSVHENIRPFECKWEG